MASFEIPTPDTLRQLMLYDTETGILYWRERPVAFFEGLKRPSVVLARSWNAKFAGKPAFTYIGNHGYREGAIFNRNYLAHRVAFAIVHGNWPVGDVDHIDGDTLNNRIANLRDVPTRINIRNCSMKSNNASGVTGVSWRPNRGKWRARIMVDGKERCLGHFDSIEEAKTARDLATPGDGFTSRHGSAR